LAFWALLAGERYLCRITYEALDDDYPARRVPNRIDIFQENRIDILRRARHLLPENPVVEEGKATVVIGTGQGL